MNDFIKTDFDALNRELMMMSGKELTKLERQSLKKGVKVMQKETKRELKKVLPSATRRNPKYNDTLMQGVLTSVRELNDSTLIGKVHIMGNRKRGGGTFRLRFFETGTTRYRKDGSIYGVNRGERKYNFFDAAYNNSISKSQDELFRELTKRIEDINNG